MAASELAWQAWLRSGLQALGLRLVKAPQALLYEAMGHETELQA